MPREPDVRRTSREARTYLKFRRYTTLTPLTVPASARSVTCCDSAYSRRSALDASDNVYLTDPENHRVLKYTNDGKLLAVLGKPGTDLASFNLPTGIAMDAQGGVVVVDSGNNRMLWFDALSK